MIAGINADTFGPHLKPWRLPLLYAQGQALKLTIRRMPEPPGARSGVIDGQGLPLRMLVLGDSAAVAVGAATQERGLAASLGQAAAARTGRPVHWQAIGRSGLTAAQCRDEFDELLQALDGSAPPLDLIATSLGGNDVVRLSASEEFRSAMGTIVDALQRLLAPNGRIVVGRAPPFHCSPLFKDPLRELVAWRVDRINGLLAEVAATRPALRMAREPLQLGPGDFAEDGFHPSESSYQAWAGHVLDRCGDPD